MGMANIWWILTGQRSQPSNPRKLPIHHHKLYTSVFPLDCFGCSKKKSNGEGYHCIRCKIYFHKDCAESRPEIDHPSHPAHPLKLIAYGPPGYNDGRCRLCGEDLRHLLYHCSICNFSLDTSCARKQESIGIEFPKAHEHRLDLLSREVSFTCDACGMRDVKGCPYVCRQCSFMIHKDCVYLPRVIHITRHEHRISRTYFVGIENLSCGVCRLEIDGKYGAYCCSSCRDYAVHLRCATKDYVWDGRELEGVVEEAELEDIKPFKVIDDNVIDHFSHEHHLKLDDYGTTCYETIHCNACTLPVYRDPFYSCSTCDFILHKTCANLPRKIRNGLHKHPLTLYTNDMLGKDHNLSLFYCTACKRFCNGFRYKCCDVEIDVRCGSICEPFMHESHSHPLFLTSLDPKTCGACSKEASLVLNCVICDFALCFDCATLPKRVIRQQYDSHFLSLCFGESSSNQYWCDNCEREMDPNGQFYTCDECCSTLHINCVLGDFPYWRPGYISIPGFEDIGVVPNKSMSRPYCSRCHRRCEGTSILVTFPSSNCICSIKCFEEYVGYWLVQSKFRPLPQLVKQWERFRQYMS